MAERKVVIQNKICSECSASTGRAWNLQGIYTCQPALLELKLGRIPTVKDVMDQLGWEGSVRSNVDSIPPNCPNGYHTPENLPLR